MTRAEEIAAALQSADAIIDNLERGRFVFDDSTRRCIQDLARLLRESQSEPPAPAVGEDEGLLAEADGCCPLDTEPKLLIGRLATRLRAALSDLARVRVQRDLQRTAIQAQEERHSAALAAAEQEKEKAVAEEREACARVCNEAASRYLIEDDDAATAVCDEMCAAIRARAGRNDG